MKFKFKHLLFVSFIMPAQVYSVSQDTLRLEREEIETLIAKKDVGSYETACEAVERYLSSDFTSLEEVSALKYAMDKAKFFASLNICTSNYSNGGAVDSFYIALANLNTTIILNFFEYNPSSVISFVEEILALVSGNRPDIASEIIEILFYTINLRSIWDVKKKFDYVNSLIDMFLSPDVIVKRDSHFAEKSSISFEKLNEKYPAVYEIISDMREFILSDSSSEGAGIRLNTILFGKKYVEYFFTFDQKVFRTILFEHFEVIKKQIDGDVDFMGEAPWYEKRKGYGVWILAIVEDIESNDKEAFVKTSLNSCAECVASIGLSVSLLMDEKDGIEYLNEIYNALIQNGYLKVAEDLKQYVINISKTRVHKGSVLENGFYSVINPAAWTPCDLIVVPEYLSKAFID